jgi:hypothetical protein
MRSASASSEVDARTCEWPPLLPWTIAHPAASMHLAEGDGRRAEGWKQGDGSRARARSLYPRPAAAAHSAIQ